MRVAIVVAVACLSATGFCAGQHAQASIKKSTNIPAQELVPALKTLAHERGFQVAFLAEVVGNKRTQGAVGDLTTTEALTRLLEGTNLVYSYLDAKTVTILPVNSNNAGNLHRCSDGASDCIESYSQQNQVLASAIAGEQSASVQNSDGESNLSKESTTEGSLGEIVVTATRRSESALRVPAAITALPERFLQESASLQLDDVVRAVPGLSYTQNSVGQAVLAIRGVQTSAAFGNTQSPVALYYDEVPVLDPYVPWEVPQLNLFDVNRIEVLTGPQGTLFGAGSLSGAIRVITNKPDASKFDAAAEETVDFTQGGDPGYAGNLMINVPLIDGKLAVRGVGYYTKIGGWIDNPTLGRHDGNSALVSGGRGEVRWTPTSTLTVTGTAASESTRSQDANYLPYGSKSFVATNRLRNFNDDRTDIFNLTGELTFPFAVLTSSTSYLTRLATSQIDFSTLSGLITGLPATSPLIDQFNNRNFVQEVRLASTSEHPFKWLIGAYVQRYKYRNTETVFQKGVSTLGYGSDYLEAFFTRASVDETAGFGELSYDVTPKLIATAGARYSSISVDTHIRYGLQGETLFDGIPRTFDRSLNFKRLTPKFSLSYQPTADVMVYALAAQGYRAGSTNLTPTTDPITGKAIPPGFGPDYLWNYEMGFKGSLFDHRLMVTSDVYYIDWRNIILQQVSGGGLVFVGNAGQARSVGAELQVIGKVSQRIELGGSFAYNDAKLRRVDAGVPATEGDRLPGSAPFTAYLYSQLHAGPLLGGELTLRADYSYTGREFSYLENKDNPEALRYGDYSAVGGQATISWSKYDVMLFVRNAANAKGRIAARKLFPLPFEILQTPRTIGVTLRARL